MSTGYPTYSPQDVANRFLELADGEGRKLTNMQLQKLVYIAHGMHLGMTSGKSLIERNVHAWQWGPVIPKLYKDLQKFGNGHVTGRLPSEKPIQENSFADKIIKHVWGGYGRMTGGQLSTLTHMEGSPWDKTWNRDGNKFGVIPVETIADYYAQRLRSA